MPGMWPVRGFEVWVCLVSGWILCFGTASGWCTEGTQRGQQSTARSLLRVTHCVEWKIKNLVHTLPPSTSPGCSQLWPWTLQVWGSHSSQSPLLLLGTGDHSATTENGPAGQEFTSLLCHHAAQSPSSLLGAERFKESSNSKAVPVREQVCSSADILIPAENSLRALQYFLQYI